MNQFNYDFYCGIYCGACDIHQAYKTGRKDSFASLWTEPVLRALQKTLGNTGLASEALQIRCHGCKSDAVFINCTTCKIRSCAIEKKIDHCIDCTEYPCPTVTGTRKLAKLLPHVTHNAPNLETIKKKGVQQWLAEQERRWKCPDCGTSIAWYSGSCSGCGKKLKELSYTFSPIKAFFMKLSIRLAALKKR
jgi:hypothetical protein